MKLVALSLCLVIVLWDRTRSQAHAPTQCLVETNLDPSAYASDSLRKLWETLRRRSQSLASWASQRMLFNPTKTFCFLYVYFTAKFHVSSELELKKWSLEEFSGTQGSCGSCWENTVKRSQFWDLKFAYARQLIKYLRGLHTSRGGKWNPNGLLRYTYGNSIKTFENMNFASFYLCLFMNIKRFSKATLKGDIVGNRRQL